MNNTTRRHPRTLSEAFGPYAGRSIYVETAPMDFVDKLVIAACGIAAVFTLIVTVLT